MQLIDSVIMLVSKLPPSSLEILAAMVKALLSEKDPAQAEEALKRAALAIGAKKLAKAGWREAVKAKGKL